MTPNYKWNGSSVKFSGAGPYINASKGRTGNSKRKPDSVQ